MGFKKGISGNPKGRPKGAVNKPELNRVLSAQIIRMAILELFNEYKEKQMLDDLMRLRPIERLRMFRKFLDIASRSNGVIELNNIVDKIDYDTDSIQ